MYAFWHVSVIWASWIETNISRFLRFPLLCANFHDTLCCVKNVFEKTCRSEADVEVHIVKGMNNDTWTQVLTWTKKRSWKKNMHRKHNHNMPDDMSFHTFLIGSSDIIILTWVIIKSFFHVQILKTHLGDQAFTATSILCLSP